MDNKKEMTALNVSVGVDTEQPIQKCTDNSISDYDENIKSFEKMQNAKLRPFVSQNSFLERVIRYRICE